MPTKSAFPAPGAPVSPAYEHESPRAEELALPKFAESGNFSLQALTGSLMRPREFSCTAQSLAILAFAAAIAGARSRTGLDAWPHIAHAHSAPADTLVP